MLPFQLYAAVLLVSSISLLFPPSASGLAHSRRERSMAVMPSKSAPPPGPDSPKPPTTETVPNAPFR
ncbi:hypothetical protein ACFX13_005191 [Malus domestica]